MTIEKLLPQKLFQEEYNPPKTDGSGFMRKELQEATKLLQDAGWELQEGKLINQKIRK